MSDLVALRDAAGRRGTTSRAESAPTMRVAPIHETRPTDRVRVRDRRHRRLLAGADALAAVTALLTCVAGAAPGRVTPWLALGIPLVLAAAKLHGLYDRDELVIRKGTVEELPSLLQLAGSFTIAVWVCDATLLRGTLGSTRGLVLLASLWLLLLLARRAARGLAGRTTTDERLLLIGDVDTYRRLEDKVATGAVNAILVGRMSLARVSRARHVERPVDEAALAAIFDELAVERVLVVPSQTDPQVTLDLLRAVKAMGVRVSVVPHVLDVVGNSVVFDDICGMTLLGVRQFGLSRSALLLKRSFDLIGAGTGLLLAAPVLVVAAVAIRLDSRGPVFFKQERIGRDGRPFRIIKFRSMVTGAEDRKADLLHLNEAGGLFKMAADPRVTRVGRLLRRTSLDELPQLINVVRGEMSLVGPRPLIVSEDHAITGYDRRRLHLTPGMTGHWQILGSRVPLPEMLKIDYVYVTTWSLVEDLKILVRTVSFMVARRGI
jgi:exopolysaccharide biosynthesis polyprenyl glycosylphosphotransferase